MVEVVRRGEVWTANLNPRRGREVGKVRPVVILQADMLNEVPTPTIVVLPMTTLLRPELRHFRISIPARERLLRDSEIVVDQPRTVDRNRIGIGPLTRLTSTEMAELEDVLLAVLGIAVEASDIRPVLR